MFFWNKGKQTATKVNKIPYKKEIDKIREIQLGLQNMSKDELIQYTDDVRQETDKQKQKLQAYAICSEVITRTLDMKPFDVQLSGGYALSEGNIAQMRTGEGKTITALFPAFWGYVANLKTYVITVNEYLVQRDFDQAVKVFAYLGIEVGLILKDMPTVEKQDHYKKPIIYVTNSEFAFDYLRDNIVASKEQFMQGDFDFAVIDEADLVLIDEAKNPVIISNSATAKVPNLMKAKEFVLSLSEAEYEIDEEIFIPYLSDKGFDSAKEFFGHELTEDYEMFQAVRQSMMAHLKFEKDVDYIVRDGEVLIVDRFTGRVLAGRRFQQGLHQAIEAKENVEIQPENVAVATVTYQNLFRKFKLLSGMTGTGIESKKEFDEIYRMDVKEIPTNKPIQRIDNNDVLFKDKKSKYEALVEIVKEKQAKGQPVLIGTISIQESEEVSNLLDKANIPYMLLNAKNDKEEADIVLRAGEKGAVTIATNMAGRGTDIKVSAEIEELGGLYLLGVSRNESKRIDRQLIGRSGRQGQKGESQFLTSIEDEFLVKYPTNKFEKFVKRNKEYPYKKENVTIMVDEIQDVADSQGMQIRKFQFQLDEILHYQREYAYGIRKGILVDGLPFEKILKNVPSAVDTVISNFDNDSTIVSEWNLVEFNQYLNEHYHFTIDTLKEQINSKKEFAKVLENRMMTILKNFEQKVDKEIVKECIEGIAINIMDNHWQHYLDNLEAYKAGFGMQTMGEQDPIRAFSMDVDAIFKQIKEEAWENFFKVLMKQADIRLTIETHPFFTVFPMKESYLFKFVLPKNENEPSIEPSELKKKTVRSLLYSDNDIIDEFNLVGTTHVIVNIQRGLAPGRYVIRNMIDGQEINKIGFKVISEQIEEITETASALYFRLPLEHIHPVSDETLKVTFTHVYSKNAFSFDLPNGNEWVNIEKPKNQNWLLGRYVMTLAGANLPLYHREYLVRPSVTMIPVEEVSAEVPTSSNVPDSESQQVTNKETNSDTKDNKKPVA